MRYNVTNELTKISETAGTIQNVSNVYPVEVSDKAEAGSGILLFPLNQFSFNAPTLYMRCTDAGGWAECRVVTFISGNNFTTSGESAEGNEDDAVEQMLSDILNDPNADYPTGEDVDAVINEMWNSDNPDTDDGFSPVIYSP